MVHLRAFALALTLSTLACVSTSSQTTGNGDGSADKASGTAGTSGGAGGGAAGTPADATGAAGVFGGAGTGSLPCTVNCPDANNQPDVPAGPVCGNSIIETGETCDDGDSAPGDGCSGICQTEPNYKCPEVGKPCESTIVCGDGKVEGSEACDDMNTLGGDGCTPNCQIQPGYMCPNVNKVGGACSIIPPPPCGDGKLDAGETCDDKNTTANDGCSAKCLIEPGYMCPTPGAACALIPFCGDGKINAAGEECDDLNTAPGDGCTGVCKLEPFFTCPTPGKPCTTTIICGDLKVTGDEACDDGGKVAGDGCSADCKQVEGGYTCPSANGLGGACQKLTVPKCGDGRLDFGEYCDDGNTNAEKDGCTATCTIDTGYTCDVPGQKCTLVTYCGDGVLTVGNGEQCDDKNMVGGDGCSAECVLEANWACPTPGQPCVSTVKCGDKKVTGTEQCDDGNLINGDGCSLGCELECGWTCQGGACRAVKCGDGIVAGTEQCDDGNIVANDGCSPKCFLESKLVSSKEGWVCTTATQTNGCVGPTTCTTSVCGDKIRQGSEQCDDMNNVMGDGCSPFCRKEPLCPAGSGACATQCGDGLLIDADLVPGPNQQECDDGNTLSGDGCSMNCKIEPGYTCTDVPVKPNPLILPIVYRDFKHYNEAGGHPDFDRFNGDGIAGIAKPMLGANGVPEHGATCTAATANQAFNVTYCAPGTANPTWSQTTDYFSAWYTDTNYSQTIVSTLTLGGQVNGANSATCNMTGQPDCTAFGFSSGAFFPIDGMGWGNSPNSTHNYGFTSETRYWFEYTGAATLNFRGDDDVFVYINKILAVDLGGLHQSTNGQITLDPTNGTGYSCDFVSPGANAALLNACDSVAKTGNGHVVNLGLELGKVYEIVVFQAERRLSASNYRLTLSKFTGTRSSCSPKCGDTIVTAGEACDLGTAMNTGAYGTCKADCTLAPGCGDGMTNGPEQCDNGVNMTQYGGTTKQCGPGCVWAPYCGDMKVDGANGEACDDGANNGKGYGYCTAGCKLGPRCGDKVVTNNETCDDGANNGNSTSKCGANCQLKCGNGTPDVGEQCDNGTAMNTGGYGKCNANCTLAARCGDGIKNGTEQCDDGKNDGSYGTCAPGCVLGPRCGDGSVQTGAGEKCDKGASNQPFMTAYGKDVCTTRCLPAPFCGDKSVDPGEGCDDGVNSGMPGSCTMDCKSYVPLPSCGDNKVDVGEQCDNGAANGTVGNACDAHCKYACGNGFKDMGEACDNGVNDGTYGTCNKDCTLAPYCGDGTKNGPEKCDNGATNSDTAYGPNTCTKACLVGPYCGDGRIQSANGEECEGTQGCGNCKILIIQ